MADGDAEADDLGRLEAALDRIAALAESAHSKSAQVIPSPATPAIDAAALSARLDLLIGQLQDALTDQPVAENPHSEDLQPEDMVSDDTGMIEA